MSKDVYESPLSSRYASPYMLHLVSADMRFQTWRRLWTALARAEHELGLPITAGQVAELEAHITDIDYAVAEQREREVRHDVMAHVYAYGKAAPSAAGIIHLGATSCYVTDNADLILYRDGLRYLRGELLGVLANLAAFAREYAAVPTLGYTHYQPAQPVTVGKRAALWMQDFLSDLEELDHILATLKFLGCRGTTGTEASFMDLFDGDGAKIDEMTRRIAAEFGFDRCFSVCGQTYPRKTDSRHPERPLLPRAERLPHGERHPSASARPAGRGAVREKPDRLVCHRPTSAIPCAVSASAHSAAI